MLTYKINSTRLKTTVASKKPRPHIFIENMIVFERDAYYRAEIRIMTSDTKRVSDFLKNLDISDSFVFVPFRAGIVAIRILYPYDHCIIHRKIDKEIYKLRTQFENEAYNDASSMMGKVAEELTSRLGTGNIKTPLELGMTADELAKLGYDV